MAMTGSRALRPPLSLKLLGFGFLGFWCLIAAFPIFWITVMSLKDPIDAFSSNPFVVIFGNTTRETGLGLSTFGVAVIGFALYLAVKVAKRSVPAWSAALAPKSGSAIGWMIAVLAYTVMLVITAVLILPATIGLADPWLGPLGHPILGLTADHYISVWIDSEFYRNFINSMIVTSGVVAISLSVGTLAGFGLARSRMRIAFWILIAALVFRALPHSVLVAGYLPVFVNSYDILRPFLGDAAPTFYGKPLPVIFVLVAINQPFTIWMLRSVLRLDSL